MRLYKYMYKYIIPNADALVDSTEGLKNAESCILNEVSSACHQEEIAVQHLYNTQIDL